MEKETEIAEKRNHEVRIPKLAYTVKNNVIFVVSLALYVILFGVLYVPTFGHESWLAYNNKAPLYLPILGAIVLVSTAISRVLLVLFTHRSRLKEIEYLAWQALELVATCMFSDIFISLYFHVPYFDALPTTLVVGLLVMVFPYALSWLYIERVDRDVRLLVAQQALVELRRNSTPNADDMVRFVDEKGAVKFVISAQQVIAIEAAGNYVTILYEDAGKILRFTLRNTLKGIEALCMANDLLRCHRSFFVNIRHVRLLRKEGDGVFAEVDVEGIDDIPVSKMYASDLLERFGSR